MSNNEINKLIKEVDDKISKLENDKNGIILNSTETAIETIREVVSEINSIDDLKKFRDNNEQLYNDRILTIVSWFKYLEREENGSAYYEDAKKLIMSIGEKHTILFDWCKGLVEGSISN